jgi:hypothetical protein
LSKSLLPIALAAALAGCARSGTDDRSTGAPDPSALFRDVCGRIEDGPDLLARAVEARGLLRARPAAVPQPLLGRSVRVWTDRGTGADVFIALDRRSGDCTVAARKADLGVAFRRFSEDVLGQAGPYRTVARASDEEAVPGDATPVRAAFRVTPRRSGMPVAYALLYTLSGDPSAAADPQLVLRARFVSSAL